MKGPRWGVRLMAAIGQIGDAEPLELLALLTVLLLLLSPMSVWYLHTPLVLLCVIAIAYRPLLGTTHFWYTIAALL